VPEPEPIPELVSMLMESAEDPLVPLFMLSDELLDVESALLLLSPELHATANNKALPKMTFFIVLFFTLIIVYDSWID
jgi:hypothetical protein